MENRSKKGKSSGENQKKLSRNVDSRNGVWYHKEVDSDKIAESKK